MSNKKDFRFFKSQIAKVESYLSSAEEKMKKIRSNLQNLIRRSNTNLSQDEKTSKTIGKIFQIYKKAFKKADHKQYAINNNTTLRHFNDLLKYTITKEAAQGLRGTLSPQAYLREVNSKSISSLYAFLEGISAGGHIANVMKDKEKQKINDLLRKVETSDKGYKVTNWQGLVSQLKEGLKSILSDKSPLPTMTVRRIGAKKSLNKTSIPTILKEAKLEKITPSSSVEK